MTYLCNEKCIGSINYHATNSFACYPSCKAIPGDSYIYAILETTFPDDPIYKCSNLESDCAYYIYDNGVGKKCVSQTECQAKKFLLGKECTDTCNGYKLNYFDDTTLSTIKIMLKFIFLN